MSSLDDFKQFTAELKEAFRDFVNGLSGVEKKRQEIINKAIAEAKQQQIEFVRKKIDSIK